MKVYELMSKLEVLPSGAEVMCEGVKTINNLMSEGSTINDKYDNPLYKINEHIIDIYFNETDNNKVYLQF